MLRNNKLYNLPKGDKQMPCFKRFYKRERLIKKTLEIDENLYLELERLSKEVYDASITQLVNAAIEKLIKTENLVVYKKNPSTSYVKRSFLIRESYLNRLYELKEEYDTPIRLLVNMSIRNALIEERA